MSEQNESFLNVSLNRRQEMAAFCYPTISLLAPADSPHVWVKTRQNTYPSLLGQIRELNPSFSYPRLAAELAQLVRGLFQVLELFFFCR